MLEFDIVWLRPAGSACASGAAASAPAIGNKIVTAAAIAANRSINDAVPSAVHAS
jgi:hypothetical protein